MTTIYFEPQLVRIPKAFRTHGREYTIKVGRIYGVRRSVGRNKKERHNANRLPVEIIVGKTVKGRDEVLYEEKGSR